MVVDLNSLIYLLVVVIIIIVIIVVLFKVLGMVLLGLPLHYDGYDVENMLMMIRY